MLDALAADRSAIDRAMFDPGSVPHFADLTMSELMRRRAELEARLNAAEAQWLEASEALEQIAA